MLGLEAWLFANLYEGVVGVPELLIHARRERPPGLLTSGSPLRYFAPVGVAALAANAIVVVQDWQAGERRLSVATRAGCLVGATALSGYLVGTVNVRLLRDGSPLTDLERRQSVTTWHTRNVARLLLLAAAWVTGPRNPSCGGS